MIMCLCQTYRSTQFKYVWFIVCQLYRHKAVKEIYMQSGRARRMMCLRVGVIKEKFVRWEPHSLHDL